MSFINPVLFILWATLSAWTQKDGIADVLDPPLEEFPISSLIPNVANVGGLQIQGVKGDVVVLYFEPLTTQKLKSSGVPEG